MGRAATRRARSPFLGFSMFASLAFAFLALFLPEAPDGGGAALVNPLRRAGRGKKVPADERASIISIRGFEVLDSRGNPTVEAELTTGYGTVRASVPSAASAGIQEAAELRDGGAQYKDKGVIKAVSNINEIIAPMMKGKDVRWQKNLDDFMVSQLDGNSHEWGHTRSRLGASAMLAVSMCIARAGAQAFGLQLYEYIGELKDARFDPAAVRAKRARAKAHKMPVPMVSVLSGGRGASGALRVRDFMLAPTGAKSFKEALQLSIEAYWSLGSILRARYGRNATGASDEGGFAPGIIQDDTEGLEALVQAVDDAGHHEKIKFAIDVSASHSYMSGNQTNGLGFKPDEPNLPLVTPESDMLKFYKHIVAKYPVVSIEDPFDEDHWDAYIEMVRDMGSLVQVVGDGLLATSPRRIARARQRKAANALLLQLGQVGSVTEAIAASLAGTAAGWGVVISHRAGETEDAFIADLCVGLGTGQIKAGAPRHSEQVAKYNRLLRIEETLGKLAYYAGSKFRHS